MQRVVPPELSPMERLSRLLLDLHQAAQTTPPDDFQHWALERLREDIPFDSAMWASGTGSPQGPDFHALHLQHQPLSMLTDYQPLKQHDRLFAQALAEPGRSLRAASATDLPAMFRPYCERYGLAQALCTMTLDGQTALITGISLYRNDPQRPFSGADVALMEAAFAHLGACDSRCKLAALDAAAAGPARGPWASAACDDKGLLRHVDAQFGAALLAEWPDWRGPWLPEPLRPLLDRASPGQTVGCSALLRVVPMGELRLVQLRARRPVDALAPRLREVAVLAAQGLSHKAIATALGISPATARNQLATLYRRLGVSSKTALAAQLFESEGAAPPLS